MFSFDRFGPHCRCTVSTDLLNLRWKGQPIICADLCYIISNIFSQFVICFPLCSYFHFRLHAWGDNIQEAFEQCAMAMFAYMTDIECVALQEAHEIEAEGDDFESLLFHFLDEFLFLFCCEPCLIARVRWNHFKLQVYLFLIFLFNLFLLPLFSPES